MVGMLTLQNLMNGLISGKVASNEEIQKCIVRIYPKVYKSATLGVVSRILEKEPYVLVFDVQGSFVIRYILFLTFSLCYFLGVVGSQIDVPVGIVTAIDLLGFISKCEDHNNS